MSTTKLDTSKVVQHLKSSQRKVIRAAEIALDKTAVAIKSTVVVEMRAIMESPTPYTLNSLKVTKTRNHNMQASVWFKEPDRMGEHYLVPQVEGGERKEKGFERALHHNKFIPSQYLPLDRYGNVNPGLIRQVVSALGRAEIAQGFQANRTNKSAVRNQRGRDFVWLPRGAGGGKLPPGVYRRVIRGNAITAKQKRLLNKQIRDGKVKAGTYQQGKRQIGVMMGKGKFRIEQNVIRGTGLVPVLLIGKQHAKTKPLLPFYEIARKVHKTEFNRTFHAQLSSLVRGR